MLKKFKKLFIVFLLIQVLFLRTLPVSFAQVTPTDTPTETPTPTIDPNVTPTTSPTDTPTTTPTPTIDPSTLTPTPTVDPNSATSTTLDPSLPTDTPTPTTDITATNSADITDTATSSADSGNNTITSTSTPASDTNNTSSSNQSSNSTTTTGDSVAVTNAATDVNTNVVDSQFVNQTINIFATQNQDLDLTVPLNIISQLITQQNDVSPQINIQMNADNSYAVVNNNIVNTANSGGNSAAGPGQMVINTGNAYSIVTLTNKVNFTIVNSVVHVITINIFGTLNGNIILPDMSHASICSTCGLTAGITNAAQIANNVDSSAISGQNTINQATGSATITTGDAISVVNLDNIVNTNVIGVPIEHLYITTYGQWNGQFLSWGGFGPQPGGQSYAFNGIFPDSSGTGCPTCVVSTVDINNSAKVTNNITSGANTGGNTITGGSGSITTGTAYSVVSLLNFVNANFIRTFGFFGFINIFGEWNGSIGSADDFVTPTPSPEVVAAADSTPAACTTTGDPAITTTLTSNVGAYINPGDTALFYVHIKNTGPNDLQSEKVKIVLYDNGKTVGGTLLTIKKPITSGKSELVTVGLSLSPDAPGGFYTATATTDGITCDNKTSESISSTNFQVSGSVIATNETPSPTGTVQTVLGARTHPASASKDNLIGILLLVLLLYIIIRGIRSRRTVARLIRDNMSIKERLATLRMLLL